MVTVGDLSAIVNNWQTFGPWGDVNYNGIVGIDEPRERSTF